MARKRKKTIGAVVLGHVSCAAAPQGFPGLPRRALAELRFGKLFRTARLFFYGKPCHAR